MFFKYAAQFGSKMRNSILSVSCLSLSEFRYCPEQHMLSVSLEQTHFTEMQRKWPEWKLEKQVNRLDF